MLLKDLEPPLKGAKRLKHKLKSKNLAGFTGSSGLWRLRVEVVAFGNQVLQ